MALTNEQKRTINGEAIMAVSNFFDYLTENINSGLADEKLAEIPHGEIVAHLSKMFWRLPSDVWPIAWPEQDN